jgi:hypothetical protein
MIQKNTLVAISPTFLRLLNYIVKYRRIRSKANGKTVIEQLILAFAKQIVTGMPEPVWRANMLTLINECEVEHAERFKHEAKAHKEIERKASQSIGTRKVQTLVRRTPKRKTFRGKSQEARKGVL